jgi:hypothetical protein
VELQFLEVLLQVAAHLLKLLVLLVQAVAEAVLLAPLLTVLVLREVQVFMEQ